MGSNNLQDHQSKLSGPLLHEITDHELKQILDRHKQLANEGGTGKQAEQGRLISAEPTWRGCTLQELT